MNHKHLVQIFAYRADGKYILGTGYSVAPGRILTAKHVVSPKDATSAIEVRWYNLDGTARTPRAAQIVWMGGEGVDAAVLACPFPEEVQTAPYLISCAEPSHSYEWVSAGFAIAAGRDGAPTALNGKILPLAADLDRTGVFALGVDYPPEEATKWRGVSGCPVFVGQRILGVLVSAPAAFDGTRLMATATCRLLEEEDFRAAVGYTEKWKRLQDYRVPLIAVLARSEAAARQLAAVMKMDTRDAWRGARAFTAAVVDRLLLEKLDDVLPGLSAAHREMCRQSQADAEVIWQIASRVMPAVCDVADVEVGRWLESAHRVLRLPAATETLAEIILAAADGREARFEPGPARPTALLRIPPLPAGGENVALSRFEEEWHKQAIDKFVVDPESRNKAKSHDTLITLAAQELSLRLKENKERYFYIVSSIDPDEAEEWNRIVTRLHGLYPAVVFVTLQGDDRDLVREDRLRFYIDAMLGRQKRGGTP